MRLVYVSIKSLFIIIMPLLVTSCASFHSSHGVGYGRLPTQIATHEKVILVDPNVHRWGAYDAQGNLVYSGMATAGSYWCDDLGRPCKTSVGTYRINSLGNYDCRSSRYPKPNGGGLMPYCMFFNGNMALHGSPDGAVIEGNISHGCVRLKIPDAEWLRKNFATIGTKVIIKSY